MGDGVDGVVDGRGEEPVAAEADEGSADRLRGGLKAAGTPLWPLSTLCGPLSLAHRWASWAAAGDEAALAAVRAHLASGEPFADPWQEGAYRSSPAHFLQHTIVHDAHHRGQVMALLRLGGRTPDGMEALDEHWAIWRQ